MSQHRLLFLMLSVYPICMLTLFEGKQSNLAPYDIKRREFLQQAWWPPHLWGEGKGDKFQVCPICQVKHLTYSNKM